MSIGDTFTLKKLLLAAYGILVLIVIIALTGFAVNFAVYLFHALILGWGDSAPDWYIGIQQWVFYGIFVASAMFWVLGGYRRYAKKKKEQETA